MPGSFKFQVLCFGQSSNKGNFYLSLKKRRQLSLRMAFIALNNMGKGWRIEGCVFTLRRVRILAFNFF